MAPVVDAASPWGLTHGALGGYRALVTDRDVVKLLRDRVRAQDGNEAATARALGVSKQWLSLVLAGEREPGPKLLRALKLRRVVTYLPM